MQATFIPSTYFSDPALVNRLQVACRRLLKPSTRPSTRRPWVKLVVALFKIAAFLQAAWIGIVALCSLVFIHLNPAATSYMAYRHLSDGHSIRSVRFVPLKSIPSSVQRAFLRLEDHQFYQHGGISLGAIREAMERNSRIGRTVFGGSTISMQIARNLFLSPDKNWIRKAMEAEATLIMEAILGKKRILELYLNYIEFGRGVFGLGEAARFHYQTNFKNLSHDQRLRLAVIITSPLRYNVKTFTRSGDMSARYRAVVQRQKPSTSTSISTSTSLQVSPTSTTIAP